MGNYLFYFRNAIIKGAIGGDLSTLTSPDFTSKISIYVGAFFLALIILLFMFLFLCCCCTCPGCCPSKCCRKPEGEAYTKCELLWPAITLLATFLIILIAGALGVAEAGDIQTSV
ncbi:MAG: hypothetical protein E6Q33_01515 [Neisseriales bacterium]|nr:MAG: hypothetical protein E6Q33_01515 [Neisseriales bacterium]